MAIKADIEKSNFGIPFKGAYFRVVTAQVTRTPARGFVVMIDVAGYAVKPVTGEEQNVDFKRFHFLYEDLLKVPGDNFLQQCYSIVMLQSEMAGSEEV